jgi:hypothetical protein
VNWLRRYWHILVLALAPLLVLWRAVFLGQAIGPFDQIRQMSPWNGPRPSQPWDVLQADGVLQFVPWRDLVLESWSRFQVPFWNPYELGGTPLLANSQSAGLYPPHILLGVLHVPTALAMTLLAWFHLSLAGFGTHFLARQLGAGRLGGAIAGVSFTLSAFMVAWTGLPSVITTVAWIPWILGLTLQICSQPRNWSRAAALAAAFAMMVLAGHLQFVAYGGMATFILAAWTVGARLQSGERRQALGGAGLWLVSIAVGGFLAAPQLLPVLEYSKFSHRRNSPTEENYLAYQASAIQPFEMVGIMHPNLLGTPAEAVPNLESAAPVSGYWPEFVKRGANFAEGAIGLGPLVIGLLLLARRRFEVRRWGGIALVGAVAFLLATGTALGRLLYFAVPGWSSTGSPGRISFLFVLAMCVLAGVAATQDKEPEPTEKWRLYVPIAGLALIAIASIYSLMFALGDLQPLAPINAESFLTILTNSTGLPKALSALSTLVAASAIGLWLRRERKPGWMLLAATVACFFLSVPQVLRFSSTTDLTVEPPAAKFERVAFQNDAWDLWFAQPALVPPNVAALNRIHEIGGYDSLVHSDTVEMLREIDERDPSPPANGNIMFVKPEANREALSEAGVTVLAKRSPNGSIEFEPIAGKGRAYTPSGPATIESEGVGHIALRANGPGPLILKDRNMEGWTALVDGKPTDLKPGRWRELDLPAGSHSVVMNYVAPGYATGLAMAIAGIVALAALLMTGWRTRGLGM